MKKPTKLRNILVEEVSLVDSPANKRPFLFVKKLDGPPTDPITVVEKQGKAVELTFASDGTPEGTKLAVNGKDIANLDGAALWLSPKYSPQGERLEGEISVSCEYTVRNKGERDGFEGTHTYRMSKAADPEDIKNIEAYVADLPAGLRQSVENILGVVRQAEPGPVEKEEIMPEPKVPDAPKVETPAAVVPPTVDVDAVAAKVAASLKTELTADIVAAVTTKLAEDAKAAADQRATEEAAVQAKVDSGEVLEFADEQALEEALQEAATQEALNGEGGE